MLHKRYQMRQFGSLAVWALFASACCGQQVHPASTARQAGELSLQAATDRVIQHVRATGLQAPDRDRFLVSLKSLIRSGKSVRTYRFQWRGRLAVYIDAKSGDLGAISNVEREALRHRRQGRSGAIVYSSLADAKQRTLTLARKLGIPDSWQLSDFSAKGDNHNGSDWGSFGGVFRDAQGKVIATISLDSQDGVLLSFTRSKF